MSTYLCLKLGSFCEQLRMLHIDFMNYFQMCFTEVLLATVSGRNMYSALTLLVVERDHRV